MSKLKEKILENKPIWEFINMIILAIATLIVAIFGVNISKVSNQLAKMELNNQNKEKQPVFSFQDLKGTEENSFFSTLEIINIGGKIAQADIYYEGGLIAYIPELDLSLKNITVNGKNADYFSNGITNSHDYINQIFSVNFGEIHESYDVFNDSDFESIFSNLRNNYKLDLNYHIFETQTITVTYVNSYKEKTEDVFSLTHPHINITEHLDEVLDKAIRSNYDYNITSHDTLDYHNLVNTIEEIANKNR